MNPLIPPAKGFEPPDSTRYGLNDIAPVLLQGNIGIK